MENIKNQKNDSRARKGLRINFIDIILILIVVVTASVLGYIILSPSFGSDSDDMTCTIQYELEITHLRNVWSENVRIGQTMIDPTTLKEIGTVVDFRVIEEQFMSEDKVNGTVTYYPYPDFVTMTIVISTEAEKSDIGYSVEGTNVRVGNYVRFRLPNFSYEGICRSIEQIEGSGISE